MSQITVSELGNDTVPMKSLFWHTFIISWTCSSCFNFEQVFCRQEKSCQQTTIQHPDFNYQIADIIIKFIIKFKS